MPGFLPQAENMRSGAIKGMTQYSATKASSDAAVDANNTALKESRQQANQTMGAAVGGVAGYAAMGALTAEGGALAGAELGAAAGPLGVVGGALAGALIASLF